MALFYTDAIMLLACDFWGSGVRFADQKATNPSLLTHYPRNPGDLGHFGWDYHQGRYFISARQRMSNPAVPYCRPPNGSDVCRCIGWATSEDYRTWCGLSWFLDPQEPPPHAHACMTHPRRISAPKDDMMNIAMINLFRKGEGVGVGGGLEFWAAAAVAAAADACCGRCQPRPRMYHATAGS